MLTKLWCVKRENNGLANATFVTVMSLSAYSALKIGRNNNTLSAFLKSLGERRGILLAGRFTSREDVDLGKALVSSALGRLLLRRRLLQRGFPRIQPATVCSSSLTRTHSLSTKALRSLMLSIGRKSNVFKNRVPRRLSMPRVGGQPRGRASLPSRRVLSGDGRHEKV